MKRKVIQIANSTQLISLPRTWTKKHNIIKGQEVNVEEVGENVVVSTENIPKLQTAEVDMSGFGEMTNRALGALYKRGVDELRITFDNSDVLQDAYKAVSDTTIGFEILDQKENTVTIKSVTHNLEEFDLMLRRTFLLLMSMANESLNLIRDRKFDGIKNISLLEITNNRLTTVCRRVLNKGGHSSYKMVGPVYYIIEELERIADQYKYTTRHLAQIKNVNLRKEVIDLYELANNLLRTFYELFYKFDKRKMVLLKKLRNDIIEKSFKLLQKAPNYSEILTIHHCMSVAERTFDMVDAYLTLEL